jgi:hypothetical protein
MLSRRITWLPVLGLALAAVAGSTNAAEPEPMLPGDAEMVMVVNVKQMLGSPLVKKYALAEVQKGLQKEEVKQVLGALGLDPLKDIDSILLSGNHVVKPEEGKFLVVVRGRFDLDRINTVAAAAVEKGDLKLHKEGNLKIYEMKGDKPAFVNVEAGKVMVAQDKAYLISAVKGEIKPGKNLKELQAALAKTNPKDSIALAVVVTEELRAEVMKNPQAAALAPKLQSLSGNVNLAKDAELTLMINTTDAATANQVSMTLKQVLPLLKVIVQGNPDVPPVVGELLDKFKISTDKNSVVIKLSLTEEMIDKAIKMGGGKP